MDNEHSFHFKQFSILWNKASMKLSTDAVLLGSWMPNRASLALDIGTGCGVLALMLAQKTTATIDAVDIDANAVAVARENILHSSWANRIKVYHSNIKEYVSTEKKYDVIVSNPPFFHLSMPAKDAGVLNAKHTVNLCLDDLFKSVAELMHPDGLFCMVFPYNQLQRCKEIALQHGLYLMKELLVKPNTIKDFNRILLCFTKQRTQIISQQLVIRDADGGFTEEYKTLTSDFYLAF